MPQTASHFLPSGAQSDKGPISPGMSELEAGQAIGRYMDAVSEVTGDKAGDIDMFDGGLAPDERASESTATDEELERREAAQREASAAVDPDAQTEKADAEQDETEKTEETEQDEGQESADAQVQLEASQLATILGVEEDVLVIGDDGAIQLRYRVDGEQGEATLQDVLASYQLQGHVNNKSEKLSEERRQLHEATLQKQQGLQAAVQSANTFKQVMEERVLDKYSQVDWDTLKAQDPGRAALLHQEMLTEVQAIRTEAAKVEQTAQQQMQQMMAEQQQARQQWLMREQQLLFEHLPDLADEAKRPEVLRGYQEYLLGYGFTAEEIQNTHDHRMLRVINDAAAYRALMREQGKGGKVDTTPAKKRLLKVPKVARGGSPQGEEDLRQNRRKDAASALRKSGSDEDAARFAVESGVADLVLGEG